MAAYVLLDITVKDPQGYEEYKKLAPPTVASYGGKYLVRGGKAETLEGDWKPERVVMLEFDSVDRVKQWINSPEYKRAHLLRKAYAISRTIVVEGV